MGIDRQPHEYTIPREKTRGMNLAIESMVAHTACRDDVPKDVQDSFAHLYEAWEQIRTELNEQDRQANPLILVETER